MSLQEKDMEFEHTSPTFDEAQFLADFISANLEDDQVYDSFLQRIDGAFECFARKNRTDLSNSFCQFSPEVRADLRNQLAEEVLSFYEIKDKFKSKERRSEVSVIEDLYTFFQLLCASQEQIKSHDFTRVFSKIRAKPKINSCQKNLDIISENEIFSILMREIMLSKSIVCKQDENLEKIMIENKNLKEELIKMKFMLEIKKTNENKNNIFSFNQQTPTSFLPQTSKTQSFLNPITHCTPTKIQPTFSQIVNSESMISTKSVKRTLKNQQLNQSAEKPAFSSPVKPQQTLKQFNSFDPNSADSDIVVIKDDGFKMIKNKNAIKNKRVNQCTKSLGTNESSSLATKSKQFIFIWEELTRKSQLLLSIPT